MVHQTPACWGNPQSPNTSRRCHNFPYEKVGKNEPICIADEVPFDIPESWEWVTLKQIAVTALGKTLDKSKNIGEYRPYLCSINVYWTGIDLSTVKQARFEDSELSKYQLNNGDLLICEGGDVGRSAVWDRDEEMYYQNALHRVRFYGNIEPRFFQLLMESYKGAKILDNYSKGMTIKHLVQNSLDSIYFPLPPLAEQRRIVEKIKQLTPYLKKYGSVETTLSNLNLAFPDDLKKSILQYAVQGKLVPQDPADEPASVLLEHIRAEKEQLIKAGKIKRDKHESVIFRRDNSYYERVDGIERCIDDEIPFEIPDNWCWARIKSCIDVRDGTHDTPKYVEHGIPLITSKNLSNGYLDFSTAKLISLEDHLSIKQRSKVDDGDILFAMIGSIGNPVLYHGNQEFSIKNMALFKKITNDISMDYAYIFFEYAQTCMKKDATGGVQAFVSLNYLRNYLIPIPPQKEQIRIYNAVTQLHKKIDYMA